MTNSEMSREPVAPSPERSWLVSSAARVLLSVTLMVGTIGLATIIVVKATQVRQPDSPKVLHQAAFQLLGQMDNAISKYASSQAVCSTATCRSPIAAGYAHALSESVQYFRSTYLFPPSTRSTARNLAGAVQAVVGDLNKIAASSSSTVQHHLIHVVIFNDLFTALKFEHEILLAHQVHQSSSVSQLLAAMSSLVQSYSAVIGNFNAQQGVCVPQGCRSQLAVQAANRVNALATAFEANYIFPPRDLKLQSAFALSVHQIASDVTEAFVNESNLALTRQISTFRTLTHRDLARVVASQRALAAAITASR